MPPRPISATMRYGPTSWASGNLAGSLAMPPLSISSAGVGMNCSTRPSYASSDSTSRRNPSSPAQACSRNAGRRAGSSAIDCSSNSSTRRHSACAMESRPVDLPHQPHFCQSPVPRHAVRRDMQDVGRFLDAQPSEETQLDHPALAWIDLGQLPECIVNGDQVGSAFLGNPQSLLQRNVGRSAATLGGRPGARMIDQNSADDLRSQSEEVSAPLPVHLLVAQQPNVG